MNTVSRRTIIIGTTTTGLALTLSGCNETATPAQSSCYDLDALKLSDIRKRKALEYAVKSLHAEKSCSGCENFTAEVGRKTCGTCLLLTGPVDGTGHCISWAAA